MKPNIKLIRIIGSKPSGVDSFLFIALVLAIFINHISGTIGFSALLLINVLLGAKR